MDQLELLGDGVRLRPHRAADVDGVLEQCSDPQTQRWTSVPVPYTRAHAEQYVLERLPAGWQHGDYLGFAISDGSGIPFYGTIDVRPAAGGAEVGYGLSPAARGRGVATAALRLVAEWALDPGGLGLDLLNWSACVGNWSSRRVAWRAGFRVEGLVRGHCVQRGQRYDAWLGTLRRGDPRDPLTPWFVPPVLPAGSGVLRRWRDSDADACVEARADPAVRHWLAGSVAPYTRDHALAFLAATEEGHATGRGVHWAFAESAEGPARGSFSLSNVDPRTGTAEVGYWMHPAARRRGLATAAACALSDWALSPQGMGLRRLTLHAAAGNLASQRVATNAGYSKTGRQTRAEILGDGSFDDLIDFERLAR